MKRFLSLVLVLAMVAAYAIAEGGSTPPEIPTHGMGPGSSGQTTDSQTPPDKPSGENGDSQTPPEMPTGDGNGSQTPPDKPSGDGTGMGGGMSSGAPTSYTAVNTLDGDDTLTGNLSSTGTDENCVLSESGENTVENAVITRNSDSSTGGDNSSFYGVGATVLVTDGTLNVTGSTITSDAAGAAGVFAYGTGTANVSNCTIITQQNTSGGIHVAGGGTLYAENLNVETYGGSAAAIRSDRGGGTMRVNGGTYTSNGSGSPAIYVTADIAVNNAILVATGSEALCLEGKNDVHLFDCSLTGNMKDDSQNDNTWTVILYQSMSGDSEVGEGSFEMVGGSLTSENGGIFYTTNTRSTFVLSGVQITASEDCEYFLRCTGNSNARGWGSTGSNGAQCVFTGISQEMNGNVIWDSISELDLYVLDSSALTGTVYDDESCAGNGGSGYMNLYIDADSCWVVTGNSTLTNLYCAGTITDADGNSVTIKDADGNLLSEGTSAYTITVTSYSTECDASGAGSISDKTDFGF